MIKNIPKPDRFEKLGLECLWKSFEMLFNISNNVNALIQDEIFDNYEITIEDYWKHNGITVSTSLIVLFQGVEYLMKSKITEKSALLLIENNKYDWPSLPNKTDRNFDELQTISGENLLGVFCAVLPQNFPILAFVDEYKELRIMRNKLVHSTGIDNLEYKYIIGKILNIISYFYNPIKWIELFKDMSTSDPTFGFWDMDLESAYFYQILDFIEESVPKGVLKSYLPYDINSRRYSCPECSYWLSRHLSIDINPKWSFLSPNKPTSNKIECLICRREYKVQRKICSNKNCKGNVISENEVCLTCYNHMD